MVVTMVAQQQQAPDGRAVQTLRCGTGVIPVRPLARNLTSRTDALAGLVGHWRHSAGKAEPTGRAAIGGYSSLDRGAEAGHMASRGRIQRQRNL